MIDITLEVFEGEQCKAHPLGSKYRYPQDLDKMCPWLMAAANPMIQVLRFGGRLHWSYKDTPYEKIVNEDGVTTEYVRCPDPTDDGIVLKITATKITRKKTD